MRNTNTLVHLRNILCDVLGLHPDDVTMDTSLAFVRYIDWASILISCEHTFHIALEDERVYTFRRVADLVRCIDEKCSDGQNDYTQPTDQDRMSWYYE